MYVNNIIFNLIQKNIFLTKVELKQLDSYYNLIESNLHKIFLPLSHRIHKSILLWDGVSLTLCTVYASENKSTNGAISNRDDTGRRVEGINMDNFLLEYDNA